MGTNKTLKRLGFACKWIDNPAQVNGIHKDDDCKQYNTGSTTVAWLNRQSRDVAEQKLWNLMVGNIEAVYRLIERVGKLDPALRMVRISSDILPVYTHADYASYWRQPAVVAYCETNFKRAGDLARANNVRLSMHPGQFVVLASINEGIVSRSIEEFEYHAEMARWMGYGKSFQDFKINVHISGKRGPQGIREVLGRLSPEARNCITIENEENSWGLEDVLSISDVVPIVLDIHHHWCREAEYIQPNDERVIRVVDSWRGVRPTLHYSVSREDYLVDHNKSIAPVYAQLLLDGYKKQQLRAHSDFYWNTATNEWALGFLDTHDIMAESKGKNLASFSLANRAKELNLL